MTAHEFYLAAAPLRAAIDRAKRKGWIPLHLPHWGNNFLYHPNKPHGISIHPVIGGKIVTEKAD